MAKKNATETPVEQPAVENTAEQASAPVADLSISDLKNLATIIDVASSRGAFRAGEMATVGVTFNKLQAFLAQATANQEQAEETAPATAE